jgi:replicative DNA helicase
MQAEAAATDFYDPVHRAIIERIYAKALAEKPVTPLTLAAALKNLPEFKQVGGHAYLAGCAQASPSYGTLKGLEHQVRDAARTVTDLRVRREAQAAIETANAMLYDGESVIDALVDVIGVADAENERSDLHEGSADAVDAANDALREIENEDPDAKLPAADTGLARLNAIIGGVTESNLLVVGARPGMGKSIMGTLMATAACLDGYMVDYFSLEMTKRELVIRMMCDIAYDEAIREGWQPIPYTRALLRRLSPSEKERLAHAKLKMQRGIKIHDRDELTMAQIASIARAEHAAAPDRRRVIIIDHMHLIEPSDRYRGRKVDEISEITKGAKRLAKRLGAGVVLLAQLNREVDRREDKMPTLADFRDSGSIEQDADVMLGLNRPHYWLQRDRSEDKDGKRGTDLIQKANVLEIGVLKNRHGATSDITVYADVACSVFRDEAPIQGALDFKKLQRNLNLPDEPTF